MPREIFTIAVGGLKCDTPNCGFRDDTVTRDQYPQMVGRSCPKCARSLLTEADLKTVMRVESIARWINKWFGWLSLASVRKKPERIYTQNFDMNGSGGLYRKPGAKL